MAPTPLRKPYLFYLLYLFLNIELILFEAKTPYVRILCGFSEINDDMAHRSCDQGSEAMPSSVRSGCPEQGASSGQLNRMTSPLGV